MKEIRCPKCGRRMKFQECIPTESDRKRIMLSFPCYHFPFLVYNVPYAMDHNAIIKDFNSITDYFEKPYRSYYNDRYLDL